MVLQYSIGCKNNHFLSIRPMESKKKLKYLKKNGVQTISFIAETLLSR